MNETLRTESLCKTCKYYFKYEFERDGQRSGWYQDCLKRSMESRNILLDKDNYLRITKCTQYEKVNR